MKRLFLTVVGVFSLVFLNDNAYAAQQQLSLLSSSSLDGVRRVHFYPRVTIQELARVARVNQQLSKEVGTIGLYRNTNFEDVQKEIQNAWGCYREDGCYPKIKLCFMDVPCFSNTFHVKQERLITHWIKKVVRPGIWAEKNCFVGKDDGAHSLCFDGNNHIIFTSHNDTETHICIDNMNMRQKGTFNPIMNIYSIEQGIESLNQEMLDTVISSTIEIPVVVVLDRALVSSKTIMDLLSERFKSLGQHAIGAPECLQKLNKELAMYSSISQAKADVLNTCEEAEYMQFKPQSYDLLKILEDDINQVNVKPATIDSKNNNDSAVQVPNYRPCLIQ